MFFFVCQKYGIYNPTHSSRNLKQFSDMFSGTLGGKLAISLFIEGTILRLSISFDFFIERIASGEVKTTVDVTVTVLATIRE